MKRFVTGVRRLLLRDQDFPNSPVNLGKGIAHTPAFSVFSDELPPATEATSARIPVVGEFSCQDHGLRLGLVARSLLLESDCRLCKSPAPCLDRVLPLHALPAPIVSLHNQERKSRLRNTPSYSTTSAYSSTSPPARPGCPLSSHPTTSNQSSS